MISTEEVSRKLGEGQAILRYIVERETWYDRPGSEEPKVTDELGIGVDPADGEGTYGEGFIRWHVLGDKPAARLELFYDSWSVFAAVPGFWEVIGWLGGKDSPTIGVVRRVLEVIGFRDLTERERPGWAGAHPTAKGLDRTLVELKALERPVKGTGVLAGVTYSRTSGYCPVQLHGNVDGVPFLFRYRHGRLVAVFRNGSGSDVIVERTLGDEQDGFLSEDEIQTWLTAAVAEFRSKSRGDSGELAW